MYTGNLIYWVTAGGLKICRFFKCLICEWWVSLSIWNFLDLLLQNGILACWRKAEKFGDVGICNYLVDKLANFGYKWW